LYRIRNVAFEKGHLSRLCRSSLKVILLLLLCPLVLFAQKGATKYCDSSDFFNNRGSDYFLEGEWELARSDFFKSIEYSLKCNPDDSVDLIPALLNLGAIHYQVWEYDKALDYYHHAENIYKRSHSDNYEYLFFIYSKTARIYSASGDYSKAEEYYINAMMLYKEKKIFSELNRNTISYLYNGTGVLYKRMRNYPKAIEYYNKALENHEIEPSFRMVIYANMANAYREMKEYRLSEDYFVRAIKGMVLNDRQDSIDLIIYLTDYSNLLLDISQFEKAKKIIEKGRDVCNQVWKNRNPQLAEIQVNMGRYYEMRRLPAQALYWYQESLRSLYSDKVNFIPGMGKLPQEIVSKQHFLIGLKNMAKTCQTLYTETDSLCWLKKSLALYEQCIKLTDIIRHSYLSEDSRLFLVENEKATLNAALQVTYSLYQKTLQEEYLYKAFDLSERSKSVLLLSSIQSNSAITFGGIPESLGKREKELIRNISVTEENIYEEERNTTQNAQKLLKLKNNLLELKGDYGLLIDSLEKQYPRYYELKYQEHNIGKEDLAALKKKGFNIVEFNMADTLVSIFVINRQGIHYITEPLDNTFYEALHVIMDQLQHFDPTRHQTGNFKAFCSQSYHLYLTLFKPLEKYLDEDQIIIIPDEILSYLPFEILIDQMPEKNTSDYRNLSYLIKKYTLGYSYSASLLVEDRQGRNRHGNRRVLAMAPSYKNEQAYKKLPETRLRNYKNLYPLPGAFEEVSNVSKLMKGLSLVGDSATEIAFKQHAPGFGILHLAMHTLIDNRNPLFSKLVFSPGLSGPDDGLLNTYELYNMQLDAKMVVLSACRSGDGILQKGEGIMSLARGFLYAGCQSLVMTLWNVEDRSGQDIMQRFYHLIKKGRTKNCALRIAKLKYLASAQPHKTHPYYWAGYVQIGEPDAIFMSERTRILLFILIPLFLILLDLFVLFFRQMKGNNQPSKKS
jgi:CHAT domain-containing protein/tetratricopeptide (TPR) repeat protein